MRRSHPIEAEPNDPVHRRKAAVRALVRRGTVLAILIAAFVALLPPRDPDGIPGPVRPIEQAEDRPALAAADGAADAGRARTLGALASV